MTHALPYLVEFQVNVHVMYMPKLKPYERRKKMDFQISSKKVRGSGYCGSDCSGSICGSTFILEDDSCYTLTNIFFLFNNKYFEASLCINQN